MEKDLKNISEGLKNHKEVLNNCIFEMSQIYNKTL